tara:strand:- start:1232 stop:1831 length:600 start_codon:yes stop_codon:yes gene_type:complete
MFTNKDYILASSSNSRYKILKNAGFPFKQLNPSCDEEKIKSKIKKKAISPVSLVKKLSYAKALSISKNKRYAEKKIIGCDTLVYLNNTIFDKAKTLEEAKWKIKKLSGKKHTIISGITICRNGKIIWQRSVSTDIKIRKLTNSQINLYLQKSGKQILQSVGCYQIESLGPNIIESIKGDFFNVMGLPLFDLLKYVSKNG